MANAMTAKSEQESGPFIVMCQVSGGVTGFRQAVLKRGGQPVYFDTREEAQAEATRLNKTMGRNSLTQFKYWVESDTDRLYKRQDTLAREEHLKDVHEKLSREYEGKMDGGEL